MTPPTDQLAQALRQAADDLIDRERVAGPDARQLWGRGRRVTWAGRAAGAGLVVVAVLLVGALALVIRPVPASYPADGSSAGTYPEFVSELFSGGYRDGSGPVFGFVAAPQETTTWTYVIDRSGLLSLTRGVSPLAGGGVLAPDGLHLLTPEGLLDLSDGVLVRPMSTNRVLDGRPVTHGVWAPDSRHVLVDTVDGPAVLDQLANVTVAPGASDKNVMPAGWRDATTLLGVRDGAGDGAELELVTRGLKGEAWTPVSPIVLGEVEGQMSPGAVHASPDGSRLLLLYPVVNGSAASRGVLVDARSGQRVAFTGASTSTVVAWDACTPVWQGDQPLTASGGLRRPGDGAMVLRFSGRVDIGCVSLAGAALTGTPESRSTGVWREQIWRVALPVSGALALVGAVWMVVALRRSRRHGERFLPMIWSTRF